jgi:hypothetical protein
MSAEPEVIAGLRVLALPAEGPIIAGERDATDLIGEAFSGQAGLVAIPLARLSPDFLALSTRLAGDVLQKFVTYGLRVAILGDVSRAVEASDSLRDFVRESNRGQWVWFLNDLEALRIRLDSEG